MADVTGYTKDGADDQFVDSSELTTALAPYAKTSDVHSVPSGGTSGQMLAKNSGTDYDTGWIDQPSGSSSVSWDDVADKPSTFAPTLGTTSSTALAGDTTAADIDAVPQEVASGASAVRVIGYGTTLPTSATEGDVFFLQDT